MKSSCNQILDEAPNDPNRRLGLTETFFLTRQTRNNRSDGSEGSENILDVVIHLRLPRYENEPEFRKLRRFLKRVLRQKYKLRCRGIQPVTEPIRSAETAPTAPQNAPEIQNQRKNNGKTALFVSNGDYSA